MTRQEAIAVLESDAEYMYSQDSPYNREAYRMAVEALKAEPVRHGHWDYIEEYFADRWWNTYQCSVCGHQEDFEEPYKMKYCPECGARMDEVEK